MQGSWEETSGGAYKGMFRVVEESAKLFLKMAPFLLLGIIFAGLIKLLVPEESVSRHLGGDRFTSVLKATLFGIPLPLCSCGVIPVAVSLRRQGAGKGASLSFLISTPTTGIDSILATYSLLGWVFTAFRIAASFVSGVICGFFVNLFEKNGFSEVKEGVHNCCSSCCSHEKIGLKGAFRYAFVELLGDIGKWLILGTLLGGLIMALVPRDFISSFLGSPFLSMILMLLIGIPIYVCATGSIPLAAALIAKGMSPGAGLVFLIAGPATNTVNLAVLTKEFGKKAVFVYLASISFVSLLFGYILNLLVVKGLVDVSLFLDVEAGLIPEWIELLSALVLLFFIGYSAFKK